MTDKLETVGVQHLRAVDGQWNYGEAEYANQEERELVTRSQAEAIIAAKNARIKELVQLLDQQLGTPCEQIAHSEQVKTLKTQLAAARKAIEVYGPYTPTWLGPCVWAGIKEELPPQLVDREVWISTSNPNEVKS